MSQLLIDHPSTPSTEAPYTTERERWEAVRRRDPAADGRFYFAVRTTGVYCRPSCAARPARPEHVEFYQTRQDAEQAGFRPCKQCRPDLPPARERAAARIAAACRTIETAEEAPPLAALAADAGLAPAQFHRLFKRVTGVTPRAYAAAQRQRRVQERLHAGAGVTEAISDAGFNSSGRFYEAAPDMLGMTPTAYRRGGQGEVIRYAVRPCSLGQVLVAATDRGICAILLGDDSAALVADLERRFPRARLVAPEPAFADWVEMVVRLVDDPAEADAIDLPLDIRGTAFQRRVWEELRRIPAGTTLTYSEVAQRLGSPGGARAVAAACAANRLAVAIPCHRVVGTDGRLAGYRWGIERKRRLLEQERR